LADAAARMATVVILGVTKNTRCGSGYGSILPACCWRP
jgi:hypothetical protein